MFNKFPCRILGNDHNLYITADLLTLADVFEAFHDTWINPTHLYPSPALAWQSAFNMTDYELDVLTDKKMHLSIERGLKGAVATTTHLYACAHMYPFVR